MKQITIKNFYSYEVQRHPTGDGKDIVVWGLNDMQRQDSRLKEKRYVECEILKEDEQGITVRVSGTGFSNELRVEKDKVL